MKSFVISENRDSYLGMKLAGIEGAYVRDQETIESTFKEALKNKERISYWIPKKRFSSL